MSLQFLASAALAGASAWWFLRGGLQAFRQDGDCASGCGGCARACPFQAPARPER